MKRIVTGIMLIVLLVGVFSPVSSLSTTVVGGENEISVRTSTRANESGHQALDVKFVPICVDCFQKSVR